MDEKLILNRIHELVEEEHRLRAALQAGGPSSAAETVRLRTLEESLDQCWDLLRRRRAAGETRMDPDAVEARSVDQVEGYLQ